MDVPQSVVRHLGDAEATGVAVAVAPHVSRALGLLGLSLIHGLLTAHRRSDLTVIRAVDEADNAPLTDLVGALGTEQAFVFWPSESAVVELPANLISDRWEDLWSPSSDDLLILAPETKRFVYINHEEWITWGELPYTGLP